MREITLGTSFNPCFLNLCLSALRLFSLPEIRQGGQMKIHQRGLCESCVQKLFASYSG